MSDGHRALVGVGVGDPALLTLRATELLRSAEVVIFDPRISEAILAMIPARAKLVEYPREAAVVQDSVGSGVRVVWLSCDASSDLAVVTRLLGAECEVEVVPGLDPAAAQSAVRPRSSLSGKCVIVARARPGLSELARRVRDSGGVALELPHVERSQAPWPTLSFGVLEPGDVILLTSVEAVEAWLDAASSLPVIALGSEIAALLRAGKATPVATLSGACFESVLSARAQLCGRRVLIPLADNARTSLLEPLNAVGAKPVVVRIAPQVSFAPARWPGRVDLVLLPSSLAALALYADAPPQIHAAPAIAIGPQSAAQATRSGARSVRVAAQDTVDALLASALEFFTPFDGAVFTPQCAVVK